MHVATDFSSGIQRSNSLSPSSFSNPAHRTTGATGTSAHSQPSTQASLSSLFHWNPGSGVGKKRKHSSGRKPATKKKLPTWSHTFVCLSNSSQDTIPDGEERAALQIAGLGEKKISFCTLSDAQDIYHDLLFHFPKLSEAGGFELLRLPEGGGSNWML